jgi:hypothetical protein
MSSIHQPSSNSLMSNAPGWPGDSRYERTVGSPKASDENSQRVWIRFPA